MARMMLFVVTAAALVLMFSLFLPEIDIGLGGVGKIISVGEGNRLNITLSDYFNSLFSSTSGILSTLVLGVGALITGLYARANYENFIILGFITGVLAALVGAFVGVAEYVTDFSATDYAWLSTPVIAIMGLFTVAYIITMVEFFRGNV